MRLPPKFILMTGVTSGIGLSLVEQVVSQLEKTHQVHLCITCRNMEKGESLKEALETLHDSVKIFLVKMDVGSVKDVLRACMDIKPLFPKLDCMYFNAGIMPVGSLNWKYILKTLFCTLKGLEMFRTGCGMFSTDHFVNEEGVNNVFATNVLGHFVLFHQMIPLLTRGNYSSATDYAQIIWTTSANACKEAYDPEDVACASSHVVDPGTVMTNITGPILPGWMWYILLPICRLARFLLPKLTLTPYNAAQALVWCVLQNPKDLEPECRYCSCTTFSRKNYIKTECMECEDSQTVFESMAQLAERAVIKQCVSAEGGKSCVLCKFFGKRRSKSNCNPS